MPNPIFMKLIQSASIETTPKGAKKIGDFQEYLPENTPIYITFLPGSDFADTVETALTLKSQNMIPIPHIAARSLPSKVALELALESLQKVNITEALLIGGGVAKAVGPFAASIDVLETGLLEKYGIQRLGIAGHPEGSPDISPADVLSALHLKSAYAAQSPIDFYITTQFCFEAEPLILWQENLKIAGITLPVKIGVPGVATIKTLVKYAVECGIGTSMRVVTNRAKDISKLMTPFPPDLLIQNLADHIAQDDTSLIKGIHLYPLGGLAKTALWMREAIAKNQI